MTKNVPYSSSSRYLLKVSQPAGLKRASCLHPSNKVIETFLLFVPWLLLPKGLCIVQ